MNIGFEKAYLLQTPLNQTSSEIIPTYVYKVGLQQAQYSFAAAIGLFNAVINLFLLWYVNRVAKRLSGNGLW
ncbi:ABC-type polysaccharide transport system [Halalkalibacter hemicellulosilyticusJCM 9152]|uniref:ABC-type polysaccharide transport system n=2 Tax=Halalkalibacter TaxID=2893056 RepID=W4Q9Q9_9BACI|nr:ABC-type polysaccharide transport system [Halalkalibacter hemicellulosilyticusJCM 9152]